jgi:predicted AAA+ superfamily ATPase
LVAEYLADLPAVAIEGAKAVGKTRTAARLARTVFSLARSAVVENLRGGTDAVVRAASPVLVDEWQRLPQIWDDIRSWIDEEPVPGRFLLTGSAAPRGVALHSGAGRIASIRMRPLSLAERGLGSPSVSLTSLLAETTQVAGATEVGLADYVREITGSGFPAIRALASARARSRALDGYLEAVVHKQFPELGLLVRKPASLLAWLRGYALATSSTSAYTSILDAATPGQADKPSKSATLAYRDALASLWLIDPVPAWEPLVDGPGTPLVTGPKHHLADPALAARLLSLDAEDLVAGGGPPAIGPQTGTVLGRLFESLVTMSVRTYAHAANAQVRHLRTANGKHEVDLLVERGDTIVAVEVKLAAAITGSDGRHLHWLERALPTRRIVKVFVNTGPWAYTREDGVHVVPAALLGP